ncbi:MAG: STAS domain-containing protein [Coriobacteriia bacterium]|nr:STAS domain-containing protein [Coriobacteriia bacterium]MBN2839952.1 STAS domain-containing protein [Coriobacteriia bacterium]
MELDITTERTGESCVIAVAGEVDVYTAPGLKREIGTALEDGCTDVIVDLERIGFIDSSGLGVLVSALRKAKEQGGTMRLVCTRESILKIFRITGLDKVFPLFASVEEARDF